jgi:hypothetical protein
MAGRLVDAKRSGVGGSRKARKWRDVERKGRGDEMRKEEILVGEGRWQRERERECVCVCVSVCVCVCVCVIIC